MIPKLTESELQRPRAARELYEWVQRIHGEFGETAEGKSALRRRSAPYLKEFLEEIWPLANYAWLFFRDHRDVRFQPVIGNQSYDALLVDESGSTLCRFEITQALHGEAGYQDRLRREHLEQYGHAPLTGPRLERGPDSGGIAESWGECVEHTDAVEATLCQIRAAIQEKAAKAYPADTALIVEFQGIPSFRASISSRPANRQRSMRLRNPRSVGLPPGSRSSLSSTKSPDSGSATQRRANLPPNKALQLSAQPLMEYMTLPCCRVQDAIVRRKGPKKCRFPIELLTMKDVHPADGL
jgi:hypothetical protein